jgi:hypothetical protein
MICLFPRYYKKEINKTPRDFIIESQYPQYYDQITLDDIENIIINNKSIVDDWVNFTEDKRWTPAWGLKKIEYEEYCLFYVPADGGDGYSINICSDLTACALMVRFEMEDLRLNLLKDKKIGNQKKKKGSSR